MTAYALTIKDGRRILTKMSGVSLDDAIKQLLAQQAKIENCKAAAISIETDEEDAE